tara:strand:- start:646887 stop:647408 length:522 start_codon:yes stop_codon:yes gene_type:complete
MKLRMLSLFAIAAMMVCPTFAADEAKKGKKGNRQAGRQNVAAALMKQLAEVGLTDEQKTKITEMGKKAGAEIKAIREEAGFTADLSKKLAETQRSMKDSEKKGKDRMAAIHEAAGLSEAQIASLKKANEVRGKFQKDVVALLTAEQKTKLPEQLSRTMNRGKKGQGKKKKDAA